MSTDIVLRSHNVPAYAFRVRQREPDGDLNNLISHWDEFSKNLVVFLGAGASVGARNDRNEPLPAAYQLRNLLWREFMLKGEDKTKYTFDNLGLMSLEHTSALIEASGGRHYINRYIRDAFSTKGTLWQHAVLSFLKPRALFTTNYDMLIETGWTACPTQKKPLQPVFDHTAHYDINRVVPLFKPHGSIVWIDEDGKNNSLGSGGIVLTQFDYFQMLSSHTQLIEDVVRKFSASCIIFIGYSFLDSDIGSILWKLRQHDRGIPWYAVFPRDDRNVHEMYARQMGIYQIDCTFFEFMVDLDNSLNIIEDGKWKPDAIVARIRDNLIQECETSIDMRVIVRPDAESVNYENPVEGTVFPPGSRVQVFVNAADMWCPQRAVRARGFKWRAVCQFGSPDQSSARNFKVVAAVVPDEQEMTVPLKELPSELIRSDIVQVTRME